MTDDPSGPPDYKVYRSRRTLRDRLRPPESLAALRSRTKRPRPDGGSGRGPITAGRVVKWILLGVLAWILLSLVIFLISAQVQQGVSRSAEQALDPGSSLLAGSTVLVLGSDARPKGSREPGAGGPARADSILLLRGSVGEVRRVSVLRDSYAQIPGDGAQKINAAYAIGGAGLMSRTVKQFLGDGVEINHLIEVNFEDFPAFINALGGINVELKRCVRSAPFSGRKFSLGAGGHHLNGRQALAFARVRKNKCAPNEDDRQRAARQQQVISAIRSRMLSPAAFIRLPWVAWKAPQAIRTDLAGPGLFALFLDVMTGGSPATDVVKPSGFRPDGALDVSEAERAAAVRHLKGVGR